MTESSLKIRTDFLKSLGIMTPCPSDYDFIAPIPDTQLLKSLVKKGVENKAGVGLLVVRYGVERHIITSSIRAFKKMQKIATE